MTPLQVREKLPGAPFSVCCLISALLESKGRVVTLDTLDARLEELRGYSVTYATIRAMVKSARKELAKADWQAKILTERQFGYRIELP